LSVVPVVRGRRRPTPPPNLSEAEGKIWSDTTAAMLATWFIGSKSVLRAYVVQAAACAHLQARIRAMLAGSEPIDRTLLATNAKATQSLIKLAQSLRLTLGSRATPKRASQMLRESNTARPWETAGLR